MSKRSGWRSAETTYKTISRELQRLADLSRSQEEPGRYLRQYKGGERWNEVPLAEVKRKLAMYFQEVSLVLTSLKEGQVVETNYARYKWEVKL